MKTLDEVITIMEGVGLIDWGADALHYLKEYREISKAMNPRVYIPDGYKTAKLGDKNK